MPVEDEDEDEEEEDDDDDDEAGQSSRSRSSSSCRVAITVVRLLAKSQLQLQNELEEEEEPNELVDSDVDDGPVVDEDDSAAANGEDDKLELAPNTLTRAAPPPVLEGDASAPSAPSTCSLGGVASALVLLSSSSGLSMPRSSADHTV